MYARTNGRSMFYFYRNRKGNQISEDYQIGAEKYFAYVIDPHSENHLLLNGKEGDPLRLECGATNCYLEQVNMNAHFDIDKASNVTVRSLNQ